MAIHLRPDIEELIRQDILRGHFKSVDEYVECAVRMLHEREEWLMDNRTEISLKIDAGYAAAQRGELVDSDQVKTALENRKRAWRENKRRE
ncbi:MAG TPA: hypothetical protein VFB79_20505 [Candidatus Angelobacter sp.]|nr:hypothetical protein [Candidatus Angelobacter sp.]